MMTKNAIFYFSGTGNTLWAANQLAERLQNCPVYSIEAPLDFTAIIDTLDQVVFAYPIYGSDLPLPMKQFLMRLPLGERTIKTYSIVTQWQFSGDGGVLIREFLPKRFALSGSAHIFMPNNISVAPLENTMTASPTISASTLRPVRTVGSVSEFAL
ncbi:MAG: EFR1 family ferrodoxin [Firmicutes bacterium]|nr:EFR1 family ferrodoxin [Bacillota bacterium]